MTDAAATQLHPLMLTYPEDDDPTYGFVTVQPSFDPDDYYLNPPETPEERKERIEDELNYMQKYDKLTGTAIAS